jgi:hypothetical protein
VACVRGPRDASMPVATFLFLDGFATFAMTMGKIIRVWPWGRRLKGLDEFETPEFVGRMARIERRRRLAWLGMLAAAVGVGAAIGLVVF